MAGQANGSSTALVEGATDDQIERDAEKAYKNMSVEARVVGNLVSGVDDDEFEQVWEEKTSCAPKYTASKPSCVVLTKDSMNSSITRGQDSVASSGVLSPSSLAGFQTVSLTTLPGSRLQISK